MRKAGNAAGLLGHAGGMRQEPLLLLLDEPTSGLDHASLMGRGGLYSELYGIQARAYE